jgi:hypothetical protein
MSAIKFVCYFPPPLEGGKDAFRFLLWLTFWVIVVGAPAYYLFIRI